MIKHEEKVERIISQLKRRRLGRPLKILKGGVSHQVPKPAQSDEGYDLVDVSDLREIIEINTHEKTAVAESGVTFVQLVEETLRHGLVPLCVPELKTITIGGAVAGCSVESASHRFGGFHDSCLEYELITPRGEVIKCRPDDETSLIFQMVHGTFGTLGILSQIKFRLMEARPFIRLSYEVFKDFAAFRTALAQRLYQPDHEFIDGIIHSPKKYVLCLARFVEQAPYVSRYDWLKVFYKSTAIRLEDYLRTADYFFRYDTECHWISRNYGLENPVLRFMIGKYFLGSTNMLKNATRLRFLLKHLKPDVVVDIFIPFRRWGDFFEFYCAEFNYFPLWIVPYRRLRSYEWINDDYAKKMDDDFFIDLAIYGLKQKDRRDYYRLLEEKLHDFDALKTLISHNSYDERIFWSIWNKKNYDAVKSRTDPDHVFPNLYQKTHPHNLFK